MITRFGYFITRLFGLRSVEDVWNRFAALCWSQHGGSGFAFTRADVLDMDADEIDWMIEEAGERRKREAEAIRKATKNPSSGDG